jgi:ABC-2 type transport system permease protein
MIFLCGLFFPIEQLPIFLRPLSYVLPLTYGADILHGAFNASNTLSFALNFCVLGAFCIFLFAWSLRNIKRRWIL